MDRQELPKDLRDLSLTSTILYIKSRVDCLYLRDVYSGEFMLSYLEPLDWPYLANINLKVLKKLMIASLVSSRVLIGLEASYPARYRSFLDLIEGTCRMNKDYTESNGMTTLMDPFILCEVLSYIPLADLFDIADTNTECGIAALTTSYDKLVGSLPQDINHFKIEDLAPLLYWNSGFDKRYEFANLLRRLYGDGRVYPYDREIVSTLLRYNVLSVKYYADLITMGEVVI